MKLSMRTLIAASTFVVLCAMLGFAQDSRLPKNTGVFEGVTAPLSPTLRYWASDAAKDRLLHSPSPMAPALLHWFHPDVASQYPQEPLLQRGPVGAPRVSGPAQELTRQAGPNTVSRLVTVTGCGTASGTVMNLEPPTNAVGQYAPQVDFLLSALGSGEDLVAEFGNDTRGFFGEFNSYSVMYVHRDATQPCYGGSDFEMGDPPINDPFQSGVPMYGTGGGRILADPGTGSRAAQFILADLRFDEVTSGIGLRRIAKSNLTNTSTCPAGTLTMTQEATCAGSTGIIVDASLDNLQDEPVIAQDPRSSGTGAGDIYVVTASERELRTVILITACKGAFASASDCSAPVILSGSTNAGLPSVAVVGGGSNAGAIVISYVAPGGGYEFVSCTPGGAPVAPTCGSSSLIIDDSKAYTSLTDIGSVPTWPAIAARTDSSGQTIFFVWSDCTVSGYSSDGCPQSQIVMETTTSLTSPSWTLHHVNDSTGHHALPSVAYDSGQNIVTIAYYSTGSSHYKDQVIMEMNQVPSGSTSSGATTNVTTSYDSIKGDGSGDQFYFEFSGAVNENVSVAAHGGSASGSSRAYLGFTNNARYGIYAGVNNTQADNNVSRATY